MSEEPFIWTLTSRAYCLYTFNLARMLIDLGIKIRVFCADREAMLFFRRQGYPCHLVDKPLPPQDPGFNPATFGSKQFQTLNRLKLQLLQQFAEKKDIKECIYLDGDIAIYKNFVADIRSRLDACPLLFQCDEQDSKKECGNSSCPWVCTGFIAWRHFDGLADLFKIDDATVWSAKPEDEAWVNHKLKQTGIVYTSLPRDLYPNGTFVNALMKDPERKKKAFLLHYNYRIGNTKKADMMRAGDWVIML